MTSRNNYRVDVITGPDISRVPCGMNAIKYLGTRAIPSNQLIDLKLALKPGQTLLLSAWHSTKQDYIVYGSYTASEMLALDGLEDFTD